MVSSVREAFARRAGEDSTYEAVVVPLTATLVLDEKKVAVV